MKNVLIISDEFPPQIGGAGVVAKDIAIFLSTNGVKVTVVTNLIINRLRNYKFELIEVKTYSRIRPYCYWRKLKKMDLSKYDIIIINDRAASKVASLFFNNELQKKCIVYLHGSEPESIFLSQSFLFKVTKYKEKYIELLNNCKNIVSVSEFMKLKFIKYSGLNKLKDKIITIYNGINKEVFMPEKVDLSSKYSFDKNRVKLLSVSRIVKRKGYDTKYHIFKELINRGYEFQWLIVGDGPYLNVIKEKAKSDNISEYITFVGRVSREKLRRYYSSVDVFWLLSEYEESLGLVYLEANACGTPTIGKKGSGVNESIIDGKTGYLVENIDECISILINKKFIRIKNNGILLPDKFNIVKSNEKLLDLIVH